MSKGCAGAGVSLQVGGAWSSSGMWNVLPRENVAGRELYRQVVFDIKLQLFLNFFLCSL